MTLLIYWLIYFSFFLACFQEAIGALENLTNDVCRLKAVNNVGQNNAVSFTWRWWNLFCLCWKFRCALILKFQNAYIRAGQ